MTMVAALDSRKLYFPKSISSSLKCELCKNLLRKPKQSTCGHRFCQNCYERRVKDSSGAVNCPVDGNELTSENLFPDRCCERDIQNLDCYCYNNEKGCGWLGQLRDLEKHEEKCEYSLEECSNPGCNEKIERRHLDDHVKKTCDFRLITCENCGANVIHSNEKLHNEKCPKVEVQCTSGCGAMIARGELEEHVTKQCVNAPVACAFEQGGCHFKGSRGDVEEHESTAIIQHIQILGDQHKESSENMQQLNDKIKKIESKKEYLESQMIESREVLAYTKQDLQTQGTKMGILEKNITKQKEELVKLKEILDNIQHERGSDTVIESQIGEIISLLESQGKRISDLEGQLIQDRETSGLGTSYLAKNSMSSGRRLERNEHICALSEARINQHDIRLQMLEATSYDGTYIWKIDEWPTRVREARIGKTTSIYSPPFYVGRYGYKVCGRLYPCGDGIGKDTHISLFFVVMKGEFDALLQWPFSQKVTFRLIDPNHLQDVTDSFRPDPKSSSFQRPKSAMNIASGTPQFVSQKDLISRGYVVEGTLYIKITVDRTGLREL
ncbi:TNF receptor-associated factor 3-like isoform X1 [Actinia tenebrosa]|uniref:TNF receptor-associated factor 3-like isoform X1 n=1 Tax=Actinia tenebrosa TaxID=6105 RepID=A0A6P8IZV3_ACTTE|nr:TNF receptor-associated factor 3-like isoform X1 [Actinia tenebrosa]